MNFPLCRHIRTNGLQCKAPALTGALHCFFHTKLYQRHSGFRVPAPVAGQTDASQHIQLAPLEDAESIQVAFSVVINALATGQLETRRATTLLYGLQMASTNAARLKSHIWTPDVIRSIASTPDGLDLAQPGEVYES